jgi:hypothetical protein
MRDKSWRFVLSGVNSIEGSPKARAIENVSIGANGMLKRAWRLVAGSFGRDAGYRNYGESINGLGGSLTRQLERLSPSFDCTTNYQDTG